ncbi:cell wall hydrolase [Camelliibacillus cellulosilyticus]|uniref:Cell wall hydrolase n=1 Tax=Camelliibacillus cellulosilyticus TaxID=2174486 RepID=A0ABV9GJ21_9BACL
MKKRLTLIAAAIGCLLPATSAFAYTVKPGDTMWKIAQNNHISLNQLESMNHQIKNPNMIVPGQDIHLQKDMTISGADRKLLAQLVEAEAGGEPFEGKVEVARVVLNRVASPDFPNTISGVIKETNQFTPVKNGKIHNNPTPSDYQAVDQAMASQNEKDGAVYFYNPDIAKSTWLADKPTVKVIGHHVFKK